MTLTEDEERAWALYCTETADEPTRRASWPAMTEAEQLTALVKANRVNLIPLIEMVEAAKQPDPEIDRQIMRLAHVWTHRKLGTTCWAECCPGGAHIDRAWVDRKTGKWVTTGLTGFAFTASTDAILDLIRKRVPKYHLSTGWHRPDEHGLRDHYAALTHDRKPRTTGIMRARTLPLALCRAYLQAEFLETVAANEGKP